MSKRRRHLDRRTAEQLLSGAPVTGEDPLTDLLAAAAAPTRDGELAGEPGAVAAFRAARPGTAVPARRPSMLKPLLAMAAALAVAIGGVATAAATGYLPTPSHGNPAPVHSSAPTSSATPSSTSPSSREDRADAPTPTTPSPAPSLAGLCNAYTASVGSSHGKAMDDPAFGALIDAAGGQDGVAAYCADLLAGKRGEGHGNDPPASTDTNHGQGHDPKGPPANHPDHPTGSPATHPGH